MIAQTLIGLIFVGVTPTSYGYSAPNAHDAPLGVQSPGASNPSLLALPPIEQSTPISPNGIKVPIFKDSDFLFVTIVPDDGTDKGGGWQEAKADLEFIKVIVPIKTIRWRCRITIGMPFRTEKMGKISPSLAATMSSGITNMVTLAMDFDLPQGIFCDQFRTGVRATFKVTYPNLGSKVTL